MRWSRPTTIIAGCAALVGVLAAGCAADNPSAATTSAPVPVSTFAPPAATVATTPETSPPATEAPASTTPGGDESTTIPSTAAPTTTTTTLPPDPPPPNDGFASLAYGADLVADVPKATGVAWRDGDEAMFVSTQPGPVYRVLDGEPTVVLDLTDDTFPDTPGSERGVLGVAFDPRDGRMFVNYTDIDDNTRVVSYELVDDIADAETRREVLFIEQPGVGHNGGRLVFDPQGNLFVGSGDGGASNGWDAQDTTKLLGTILRITPKLDGDGYDIPPDNPYADGELDRPEVVARGFRNPWTFSVDDDTGDIWIGDVGNNTIEEVSVMPRSRWGANFGWPYFEGNNQRHGDEPDDLIPPVYDYTHDVGAAVMAGHVYRGDAIPALRGAFVFGDLTGPLWAIGADGVSRLDAERVATLTGWAEGPDDELYLLGFGGVFAFVQR